MTEKYFASANGYYGFRSYFNEAFAEEKLSRLFILKGGPGTGKSTFMRKITDKLSGMVDRCELILCSSDTESLDGVIFSTENGRVAIVDGTAPHTLDPRFPGAISEIINLGDGWDKNRLVSKRDEIIAFTRAYVEEYSSAYELLSVAGRVMERIRSVTLAHFDKKRASAAAKILLSDNEKYDGEKSTRLLSSFGKSGSCALPVSEAFEKVKICGHHCSALIFMSFIKDLAEKSGCLKTTIPTALDGNFYDGILTGGKAYLIAEEGFSAEEFLTDLSAKENDELAELTHIHDRLLMLATEHFSRASSMHFSLEDIYSSLMDHSKNEEKLAKITALCSEALGL